MNNIELSGIICKPDTRITSTGKVMTRFSLCFSNGKDAKGNYLNDFIDCTFFGAFDYQAKDRVDIKGWLSVDNWEKNGQKFKTVRIMCREIARQSGSVPAPTTQENRVVEQPAKPKQQVNTWKDGDFIDDDIPF